MKTAGFASPKYVGDPINAVKIFNEKQADELIVLDIDATVEQREPDYRLIANLAAECRMPLCYGGGVRTVEQVNRIIGLGVEKVAVSAAALEDLTLVAAMSAGVGAQSVVVVFDVRLGRNGPVVWTHNGTRRLSASFFETLVQVEALGAGEIVVNVIDRDGIMKGYDLALAMEVRKRVDLPLTFLGGAGSLDDIRALLATCGVVGAAVGSLFVFKGPYRAVLINYPAPALKDDLVRAARDARDRV